jgi:superfamily II DNA or RNA helicase
LDIKIEHLGKWVRRGTLIFTYYVEGIVDRIINKVKECGLRAEQFTGAAKADLKGFVERFKRKEADVLVGSAPIGTGVDGLKHHLDRLVFLTLPWSNAEYQQIVGRLYRQGREDGSVEIIIPQVVLREERAGIWSWDDLRLRLIEYKRTLADAAVDGMIPAGGLPSREEMQRRSLNALQVWASNVAKGIQ